MGSLIIASITSSYATGAVTGADDVGGLVGSNSQGAIVSSYATGSVTGNSADGNVGRLVGSIEGQVTLTDSYCNTDSPIENSGGTVNAHGTPKTPMELRTPTAHSASAGATYHGWNRDDAGALTDVADEILWDFGESFHLPALKADFDGDGVATVFEFGGQERSDPNLPLPNYDTDGDGLIEIRTLAQLDAFRYDVDGDGRVTPEHQAAYAAAFPCHPGFAVYEPIFCNGGSCSGYELAADLDFEDANGDGVVGDKSIWAKDAIASGVAGGVAAGWPPIDGSSLKRFDGNHHIIRNLCINRPEDLGVGLFSTVANDIKDLGLENVRIVGGETVGSFAGIVISSPFSLRDSYVTGSVQVMGRNVGGLIGSFSGDASLHSVYSSVDISASGDRVGGLVGVALGYLDIVGSYATGTVSGANSVGGLVGLGADQTGAALTITASYATGSVTGTGNHVGGLVGDGKGTITASYASGDVSGAGSGVGGLVGTWDGEFQHSYCDIEASVTNTGGANNRLAPPVDMRAPTTYSTAEGALFFGWNRALNGDLTDAPAAVIWDFGASFERPVLRGDLNGDGLATVPEFGIQGRSAPDLHPRIDHDTDDDGLIEIHTLAQLAALHYDLDGDGRVSPEYESAYAAAFPYYSGLDTYSSVRCPGGCRGYELMRDLDFEDADGDGVVGDKSIWAAGAVSAGVSGAREEGWHPIGPPEGARTSEYYSAIFDGNHRVIRNLYLEKDSSHAGLFNSLSGGAIRNLGLEDADVTGKGTVGVLVGEIASGSVVEACYATGSLQVVRIRGGPSGGLIGFSHGTVISCYAAVDVTAPNVGEFTAVGGLVGNVDRVSTLIGSYATGTVRGGEVAVGGLVGSISGRVVASYAMGAVTGRNYVGGLVGSLLGGSVSSSYALGSVAGASTDGNVGGLVGNAGSGTFTDSYYNSDVPVRNASGTVNDVGSAHSSFDLLTPTAYSTDSGTLYYQWNRDIDGDLTDVSDSVLWDFGSSSQYPALKADFDGDGESSAFEFGRQRVPVGLSGQDYDTDDDGLIEVRTLAQLDAVRYDLDGDGAVSAADMIAYSSAFPCYPGFSEYRPILCVGGCRGYELVSDLDFEDADGDGVVGDKSIWAAGSVAAGVLGGVSEGWLPIGGAAGYASIFEGNRHLIRNLYIERPRTSAVGLFGLLGAGGSIFRLGLEAVDVVGARAVGGLVGDFRGARLEGSSATGFVRGGNGTGGLVGSVGGQSPQIISSYSFVEVSGVSEVGGLVGSSATASITGSYARGSVRGDTQVGGFVGSTSGTLMACYATGSVTAAGGRVGGLVGFSDGTVTASYATGLVTGRDADSDTVGCLVGAGNAVQDGHCNTDVPVTNLGSGLVNATGGAGLTTAELLTPTVYGVSPGATYYRWNRDLSGTLTSNSSAILWDFGTSGQYPSLRADLDGDGRATVSEFGDQLPSLSFATSSSTFVESRAVAPLELSLVLARPLTVARTLLLRLTATSGTIAAEDCSLRAPAGGPLTLIPTEPGIYALTIAPHHSGLLPFHFRMHDHDHDDERLLLHLSGVGVSGLTRHTIAVTDDSDDHADARAHGTPIVPTAPGAGPAATGRIVHPDGNTDYDWFEFTLSEPGQYQHLCGARRGGLHFKCWPYLFSLHAGFQLACQ